MVSIERVNLIDTKYISSFISESVQSSHMLGGYEKSGMDKNYRHV